MKAKIIELLGNANDKPIPRRLKEEISKNNIVTIIGQRIKVGDVGEVYSYKGKSGDTFLISDSKNTIFLCKILG